MLRFGPTAVGAQSPLHNKTEIRTLPILMTVAPHAVQDYNKGGR